jgi:hypothetical protein
MRHRLVLLTAVLGLVAAACGGGAEGGAGYVANSDLEPTPEAVQGLDGRTALAQANAWGTGESRVTTFVDSRVISFTFEGDRTVAIPLPEDEMVVAVAPYVDRTHPCETHFMSGCQGELVGVPVQVVVRDAGGDLLINEEMRTLDNGFIELWLPRDRAVSVELTAIGKTARGTITTHDGSNTCVTTLRLES